MKSSTFPISTSDSLLPEQPVRVLLVDDDEDDYVMTRDLLEEMPHTRCELRWASRYDDGLQSLAEAPYDVCLLDYRLGGRTGLDLMREALVQGCLTPFILLTGQDGVDVDSEAIATGAADYLVKGQTSSTLLERSIRHAILHGRAVRAQEDARRFLQSTLDALSAQVAILAPGGNVCAANTAWKSFGANARKGLMCSVGENYLAFCRRATGSASPDLLRLAEGIEAVMCGATGMFELEHNCPCGSGDSWFNTKVTRFVNAGETWIVLSHNDVTERKKMELELIKRRRDLEELTIRDPLTGLYNRRHLSSVLQQELERSARYRPVFSLAMADIDRFKRVNDTYGHQVGDAVICGVASQFQKMVRNADTVFRYGGEEVAWLLPETDCSAAAILAERLRSTLEGASIDVRQEDGAPGPLRVTVSIGLAEFPRDGATVEDLIAGADSALYAAKRAGRNRIVAASDMEGARSDGRSSRRGDGA